MNWNCSDTSGLSICCASISRGGQVRHAYLFTGPRGVGRRTLALRLAQALNCTQPPVAR